MLIFQDLDLHVQLKHPFGILLDHVTDQIDIVAKEGAALPSLDETGIFVADARHFKKTENNAPPSAVILT